MYIQLQNDNEVIGNVYCCAGFTEEIDERYIDDVKEKVKEGYDVLIRDNMEWVDGKEYFGIEVGIDEAELEKIFDLHWKKRVSYIEENYNNVKVVREILNYAENNEEPEVVINGIKEYISKLE